jgi:hypothetical protein
MQSRRDDQLEVPQAPSYPFYVPSAEDRHRFDLAFAIAVDMMVAPPESAAVWGVARVLYSSDIET